METMSDGSYKVVVDKREYQMERNWATAREILMVAGKQPPERHRIFQVVSKKGDMELSLKETVDLDDGEVKRFKTLPRDQTEGTS
jgi:hypothetical protein